MRFKNLLNKFALGAAAALAFASTPASALTYLAERAVGNGFLNLSITTKNDKLGILSTEDILDWTITLTQGAETYTLGGPESGDDHDSSHEVFGEGLTATSTRLFFDFSMLDSWVFIGSPSIFDAERFWCLGCATPNNPNPGEVLLAGVNIDDMTSTVYSGKREIAAIHNAPPIPEPATWALMITGFGLAGAMLRARRRIAR